MIEMARFSREFIQEEIAEFIYGETLYTSDIRYWAMNFLERIPDNTRTLVCSSSSGVAIAAAMCTLSVHEMRAIYISKSDFESRHTVDRLWWSDNSDHVIFVDDFIDEGRTLKRCQNALKENNRKGITHVCVSKPLSDNAIESCGEYISKNFKLVEDY